MKANNQASYCVRSWPRFYACTRLQVISRNRITFKYVRKKKEGTKQFCRTWHRLCVTASVASAAPLSPPMWSLLGDILQVVLASFFKRHMLKSYSRSKGWRLWRLIITICTLHTSTTSNKAKSETSHQFFFQCAWDLPTGSLYTKFEVNQSIIGQRSFSRLSQWPLIDPLPSDLRCQFSMTEIWLKSKVMC